MPHYHFIRNEDGSTELRPIGEFREDGPPPTPEVDAAEGVDTESALTFHRCTACGKDFSIPALLAKHFHRDHSDLDTDKTAWKTHWSKVSM
jgi:hypothetical protein